MKRVKTMVTHILRSVLNSLHNCYTIGYFEQNNFRYTDTTNTSLRYMYVIWEKSMETGRTQSRFITTQKFESFTRIRNGVCYWSMSYIPFESIFPCKKRYILFTFGSQLLLLLFACCLLLGWYWLMHLRFCTSTA